MALGSRTQLFRVLDQLLSQLMFCICMVWIRSTEGEGCVTNLPQSPVSSTGLIQIKS